MSPQRDEHTEALQDVIDAVRKTFHQLRVAVREVHGGDGLAGGRRGLMVDILRGGPQTVPALAAARPVSRQHIQTLVNGLMDEGLVRRQDNPAHKRSKLIALTREGRSRIKAMLVRERRILDALPRSASTSELRTTVRTLYEVRELFRGDEWDAILEESLPR